ncbi:hypothetical protein GCM10025857_24730 [Alicyclobacillus contaminans]|uniref:SGNH/GDSL hydrolase family protein n=1 Tax=Alicyclobacillus contaminans TaxID=392016 RepID=UPI00040E3AEE|nr:SGNH/GDSL hydrolase family protein [Alicyclobacillus contaminans]GMA51116.1 hypothetical protein GCM10025857_24730 [Alicyclobacillus contaminans]
MPRTLYLALGDSITKGVGATVPSNGFAACTANVLKSQSICTEWLPVAGPYWTTANLLRACREMTPETWRNVRVATVLIGGNDLRRRYYGLLTHRAPMQALARAVDASACALAAVFEVLRERRVPYVVVGSLYNPLPNASLAEAAITRFNQHLAKSAAAFHFPVVNLYTLFRGHEPNWIARYRTGQIQDLATPYCRPIHPNDDGHGVIAQAMQQAIFDALGQAP